MFQVWSILMKKRKRTWICANSRRWWRTGKPGVLQSMGSQRNGHNSNIQKRHRLFSVLFHRINPETVDGITNIQRVKQKELSFKQWAWKCFIQSKIDQYQGDQRVVHSVGSNTLSEILKSCEMYEQELLLLLQSCPNLCDPRDGSPPGSPIPGILQARVLEWGVTAFSYEQELRNY